MSSFDTGSFERAKACFLAGLAHLQAGAPEAAEEAFTASLALVPGRVSTLVNLAATRLQLGRPAQALATADEVLALEPSNPDAGLHRACALRALGRHADAVTAYARVLAVRDDWAQGWYDQACSLLEIDRPHDALASLDRSLALDASPPATWSCRADLLREMGRLDEARAAYEEALARGGDAELIGYCLAGLGCSGAPALSPRAYVESLFDAYAPQFEGHVVQALNYRVPELLAGPLKALHPAPFASALDLGCGTGLSGPLVRAQARHLVGVDLSQKMLEQAKARHVYDELVHADIVEHLRSTSARPDLVVAADVFIYLGDLAPVFGALERLMPSGGLFCFSAEGGASEDPGYRLQPSLRYAHHEGHLRRLAALHGFEVLRLQHEAVREEQRQPIDGMLVHLRRC